MFVVDVVIHQLDTCKIGDLAGGKVWMPSRMPFSDVLFDLRQLFGRLKDVREVHSLQFEAYGV
jgi:hypothetical protein